VSYEVRLSNRSVGDLDRLNRDTQKRIVKRLEELSKAPYDPRLSNRLTNQGGLRKSRIGGWRIIFLVDDEHHIVNVVTIERRGQVYQRI
jgi:mRNA interferase RelE/StbE